MKLLLVLSCAFVIGADAKSGQQSVGDIPKRTGIQASKPAPKKSISNSISKPKKKLVETAHPYLKKVWANSGKLTFEDISEAAQIPFVKPAVTMTPHQHTSRVGEWIDGASFV